MLLFTTDKKRLLKHFRRDPVLFAYHIGDLDDFYFPDCLWAVHFGERSGIDDVLLTYTGCETPTLLAFGLSNRFGDLLSDYLTLAPRKFYCHYQKQHHATFTRYMTETPLGTHLKMKLNKAEFAKHHPPDTRTGDLETVRLDASHEPLLRTLYAAAYPDNYFVPRMLQTGKYFGCFDAGSIVAVAGVHVSSDKHKIAVLGNIATHPDHRGHGLAGLLTYRLVAELICAKKMVCLNVKADNYPAITCYEKLGFVKVHEYEEALFELRPGLSV